MEIARRLEKKELDGLIEYVKTLASRHPNEGAYLTLSDGSFAIYTRQNSLINRVFNTGMVGPVEIGQILQAESFFKALGYLPNTNFVQLEQSY